MIYIIQGHGLGAQRKRFKLDGAWNTRRRREKCVQNFCVNLEGSVNLGDLGLNGRMK